MHALHTEPEDHITQCLLSVHILTGTSHLRSGWNFPLGDSMLLVLRKLHRLGHFTLGAFRVGVLSTVVPRQLALVVWNMKRLWLPSGCW